MCGITGYIGSKNGLRAAFDNLKKLEYRGYDSAGIAFFDESGLRLIKAAGKLVNLGKKIHKLKSKKNTAVIAHTRWATHGEPNEANAHPHHDCGKNIFLVHNGIIENYRELRDKLVKSGHQFKTKTDSEVVAHLIEEKLRQLVQRQSETKGIFYQAFQLALKNIQGAYAFAVINKAEPGKLYIARLGSPLVIGINPSQFYIASDAAALVGLARKVIYLKDGQGGYLDTEGINLHPSGLVIENLDLSMEQAKKGKYPHFMLKEIYEIPDVVRAAMLGRLITMPVYDVKLGGLDAISQDIKKIKRLEIIACGTSYYAGMVGEMLFEELADMPVEVGVASEFYYRKNALRHDAAYLFISQSGETADTLAALRKVKEKGFQTLGIVNVVGSTIAREAKAGIYNRAGAEIGVASTKAFLSQLTVLALMALYMSKDKSTTLIKELIAELDRIPEKINIILQQSSQIKKMALAYQSYQNFLYLGRGYNYPTALEGALKIKELAYVHAEGCPSGEMKHGPIALIDENFPTIALATQNQLYRKTLSNLEEIKARGGRVLAIATEGDRMIGTVVDDVIYIPATIEQLEPMLNIIPLHLFAYHFAVKRGVDVDKPRNLAKSVTVE